MRKSTGAEFECTCVCIYIYGTKRASLRIGASFGRGVRRTNRAGPALRWDAGRRVRCIERAGLVPLFQDSPN